MEKETHFDIANHFKLPIEHEGNINEINQNIVDDFEFNKDNSPYHKLFDVDKSKINSLLINKWNTYFSDNKDFLTNTQSFIEEFKNNYHNQFSNIDETLYDKYFEHKHNIGFKEKYEYISWDHLEFANKNPQILQMLTYYNLFSPAINLSIPVILLIVPFFIIKLVQKRAITFTSYKEQLLKQLKNHSLGKIFSLFSSDVTINQKIFASISVAFYFFSIYQNSLTCIKFYNNSYEIQDYLYSMKLHLQHSLEKLHALIDSFGKFSYFENYSKYLIERRDKLNVLLEEFSIIETNVFNYKNLFDFGHHLSLFYRLRNDIDICDNIYFTFNLQCYINNINSLCCLIDNGKINKCSFVKSRKSQHIKEQYYLYHNYDSDIEPIKNNVRLQNYVITGPNASGKTTLLKTTMLNIIFSQQFGYGFYKNAKILPYKILNSYINIPDTTGRDSLFQAEARRCLEILNNIKEHKQEHSFIIFDEIYSGTNPYEASKSGIAFLDVLKKYKVEFLITTHFKELTSVKGIHNYHMDCKVKDGKLKYSYKFVKGISHIQGGFNVLEELNYPKEIIDKLR